jgi:hypothetical protein
MPQATEKARNGSDQWLAAHGQPSLRNDARESICIAWFRASHPDGAAVHSTPGNPTGATGPHAIAARPPLEATRPIDEGDDGFTSGCPASTARFRRLDTASAPSASPRRLAIRPFAAKRSPASISISMASRVEVARLRKRTAGFLRRGRERAERWRSAARDLGLSIRTDFIASPLHLVVLRATRGLITPRSLGTSSKPETKTSDASDRSAGRLAPAP